MYLRSGPAVAGGFDMHCAAVAQVMATVNLYRNGQLITTRSSLSATNFSGNFNLGTHTDGCVRGAKYQTVVMVQVWAPGAQSASIVDSTLPKAYC
jgi:hypothetical protein